VLFIDYDDYNMMHHKKYGRLFPLDESRGWDQDSKSFTTVPVPLQVTVKMSSIMNAGKGVFAKEFIPRRTRIGPYKGEVVQKEDVTDKTDTSFFWEVCKAHIYKLQFLNINVPILAQSIELFYITFFCHG